MITNEILSPSLTSTSSLYDSRVRNVVQLARVCVQLSSYSMSLPRKTLLRNAPDVLPEGRKAGRVGGIAGVDRN